jgi:hypothetical protein
VSSYVSASPAAKKQRSGLLTVAASIGGLGALLGVAWGVLLLAGGRGFVRPAVEAYANQQAGDLVSAGMLNVDDLADTAYQGLQPRADIFLALGVLGLIAAVLVLRAVGWARIVLCVLDVVILGLAAVDLGDLSPGTLHALDAVMSICVLAAIVCQWLPGSNAAVRDRKAAR